jgi:hypothetical protein
MLAVFYAVLLLGLRDKSATFDEPGHATAGYIYWKYGDYRIDPENGNLAKRWIALPFLFGGEKFPDADSAGWTQANTWLLADAWFNRLGNDTSAMLARGRAISGLVAVALGALIWLWSRKLFGPPGAMVSLLLYVFSPAFLANGGLMTSDTPAALGFLAALWYISATLEKITVTRVLAGTLAIAGLFLAKMSAVLLLPMALLLVIVRVADGRPLALGTTRILRRRLEQTAAFALVAAIQMIGVVVLVWACYSFRYSAFSEGSPRPHHFYRPWQWALSSPSPRQLINDLDLSAAQLATIDAQLPRTGSAGSDWTDPFLEENLVRIREQLTAAQTTKLDHLLAAPPQHWVPRLIYFAREHHLLPEAFLYGYANVWRTSGQLAAFLNGEIRQTGWWIFFPFTFAVKTPLSALALAGLALVTACLALKRRAAHESQGFARVAWKRLQPALPLGVLFTVYWAFAITSNLNIGHRHLLPVYPPMFVLCGGLAFWFSRSKDSIAASKIRTFYRAVIAGLLLSLAIEVTLRFPNYLAYFNGIITPTRAHRHLIDSSLDWGQELPAIARYLATHRDGPAHLAYFGVGSPRNYGVTAKPIGGFPALDAKLFPPLKIVPTIDPAGLSEFLRGHLEYDPDLIIRVERDNGPAALMIQRSAALRLDGGLYIVSASMLQPLYCGNVDGYWNASLEQTYQQLKHAVQPFLAEDRDVKIAAMASRPIPEWISIFENYTDFRLARLTTFLRSREPDDLINYSVLVYRLTDADIAKALDGPMP